MPIAASLRAAALHEPASSAVSGNPSPCDRQSLGLALCQVRANAARSERCLPCSASRQAVNLFASGFSFVNFGIWLIRFFIASLSSCTTLPVVALLPRIQIVGRNHSDLAASLGDNHRDETAPPGLSVVHVSRLTAGVLLVHQDRLPG